MIRTETVSADKVKATVAKLARKGWKLDGAPERDSEHGEATLYFRRAGQ